MSDDPIESVDELCIELEHVVARARDGNVPAWTIKEVLEETADDLAHLGYVPPQWE